MYESHQQHIRGDIVSGTSFAYECLWRCRLMLRLGPLDTIAVYEGEDALITKENGEEIYYQIKRTKNYWTPIKLKSFLQRAENILKDNPKVSYVFCTNATQSPDARKEFDTIAQKWERRLKFESWEPSLEDPLDRLRNNIRQVVEKHFQPRDITWELNFGQIDNCCNKLLTLEAELKLTERNSITGEQVWERAGIKQLVEDIPSHILGDRLCSWTSWVDEAGIQDAAPFLSATRSIVLDHKSMELEDLEYESYKLISQWTQNPSESRLLLIQGVSGTGKTWLLARLGEHLSQQFPVYCIDERSIGEYPKLRTLPSLISGPTVVLIDDLIEEDWHRLVIEAMSAQPPILIIGTTSMPPYCSDIKYLQNRCGRKFICPTPLGPFLSKKDMGKLVNHIRQGVVSRREEAALRTANIRYAIHILEDRETQADLVNKVYSLWRRDEYQEWVMPLLLCSSLNIKIPRSMLREYARSQSEAASEMPDELWSLVLRSSREDDEILWIEDRDIAQRVLNMIVDTDMDRLTLANSLFEKTVDIINRIHVKSALHRQFARRIVRRFCQEYSEYQEQLLQECRDMISQLLDKESSRALVYVWLPLLPEIQRITEARKASQELLFKPPQSVSDIILIVEAFGDEHARKIIHREFEGAKQWDTEPWATFIEHLKPLDNHSKRDLLMLSIPVLQCAPIDIGRLLKTRGVDVCISSLIEECGLPEHREWFLDVLSHILPESPTKEALQRHYLMPQYVNLTSRCIMQPRNGLSIMVAHKLMTQSSQDKRVLQQLYGEIYDSYRSIFETEIGRSYRTIALDRVLNYAMALSNTPTRANQLWLSALSFSKQWSSTGERKQIERQVTSFLKKIVRRGLPLQLAESTALKLASDLVGEKHVSGSKIKVLLELLAKSPEAQSSFRLFLLSTAIVASQTRFKKSLAKQAKEVLMALAFEGGNEAKNLANSFLKNLGENVDVIGLEKFELPRTPDLHRQEPAIETLLNCLGNIAWDDTESQRLADAIYMHWWQNKVVRRNLLLTLMNLGGIQQAREIIEMLITSTSDDPDNYYFACTWEARFGDPQQAREYMANALRLYVRKATGAHLPNISRACSDLARCAESPENEILRLCSALTRLGPLKSLTEVLQFV